MQSQSWPIYVLPVFTAVRNFSLFFALRSTVFETQANFDTSAHIKCYVEMTLKYYSVNATPVCVILLEMQFHSISHWV